ncbi:MAG: EamA family transporter RarD [Candidatus Melainabacteria bacterium HGW-Melainabacteria-1]|nr:MAG: EamA family transporter RarD [Candidatus Melainabacteria bacterium HGW-Melainabacteria-1]
MIQSHSIFRAFVSKYETQSIQISGLLFLGLDDAILAALLWPMAVNEKNAKASLRGTLAAFGAYGIWGVFPLYWKQLSSVESLQILTHRILWAAIFCLAILAAKGRLAEIKTLVKDRKRFTHILVTSAIVTGNWYLYIWAVNGGRVMQSALGYYINPLLSVVMGMIFFHEKADRWTRIAVLVATAGIIGAAIAYGSVPWVSLTLGLTFAAYGALKKRLGLDPLLGLTVETLAVAPIALIFLLSRQVSGAGAYWNGGAVITVLLTIAGISASSAWASSSMCRPPPSSSSASSCTAKSHPRPSWSPLSG